MRTRLRTTVLPLAVVAVLGAACGSDGDPEEAASPDETAGPDAAPASGTDLEDGVAAIVNGEEIPASDLDARMAAAEELPQVAPRLEGDEGEAVRAQLAAQALTQMIVTEVILDSARDRGIEITEEDIAAKREELVSQAGGEQAFSDAIAQSGIPEEQVEVQLRAAVVLDKVAEELAGEDGAPAPGPTDGASPSDQQVAQQFIAQQLAEADVVVDQEYGRWDPGSSRVVSGAAPAPQAPGPQAPNPQAPDPSPTS